MDVIIVEDNLSSKEYLVSILNNNFDFINIVSCTSSVKESIAEINQKKPELVFMDVELSDGLCFEVFKKLVFKEFEVIFISAFDKYIHAALEHFAFSFITKPYSEEKLKSKLNHYIKFKNRIYSEAKLKNLNGFLNSRNPKLLFKVSDNYISINLHDIIKIIAEGNFSTIYIKGGKNYLLSKNLKYYSNLLYSKGFFRINRTTLINISSIKSIYKNETIILINNEKVHVSIRNKSNFKNLIDFLS